MYDQTPKQYFQFFRPLTHLTIEQKQPNNSETIFKKCNTFYCEVLHRHKVSIN